MSEDIRNNQGIHMVKSVAVGIAAAVLVMLLLSLITSIIVYFSPLSERSLTGAAIIINVISLFIGGFMAGHMAGQRGLLLGLITAAVILLLMILFGVNEGTAITLKVVYCLLSGMIGGIFGVR